jgi:hypothetical protein
MRSDTKQIWENTHYGFSLTKRNRRGQLSQLNNIVNLQNDIYIDPKEVKLSQENKIQFFLGHPLQ